MAGRKKGDEISQWFRVIGLFGCPVLESNEIYTGCVEHTAVKLGTVRRVQ